jgi:hypothetical protein
VRVHPYNIAQELMAERERQVDVEGWTPEHDDTHDKGELAYAAATYAALAAHVHASNQDIREAIGVLWPFDDQSKFAGDARRGLVKAGALIIAEIERLDRAEGRRLIEEQRRPRP